MQERRSAPVADQLRAIALFRHFSDEHVAELVKASRIQSFEAGDTIFLEGAKPDNLYTVLSGEVKILRQKEGGDEIELARLHAGDLFGEMALFDEEPRSATAVTVSPSEFLCISSDEMIRLLSGNPVLIRGLLAELSRKVRKANEKLLQDVMEKQSLRLEVERGKLRSLVQLAGGTAEEQNIRSALQSAVERICGYANWPVGHVWEIDEKSRDVLYSSAIWHLQNPMDHELIRRASETCRLSAGEELPGRALATRKLVWARDISEIGSSDRMRAAKAIGMSSCIAFPLLDGSDVVAVLEFFSEQPFEPNDLLLDALSAVATQLSRVVERKKWEEKLVHDAFHDALTDLPNRALFLDRLSQAISRAQRKADYRFAVIFMDLDRFKVVNDSMGHRIGDKLLVEVGNRLTACLRTTDTVARLGGDEFAILLDDIKQMSDVPRTVERIRRQLQLPVTLEQREVTILSSMGIALSSTGYERAEDVLRDADTAMYRAKSLGKGRHEIFDRSMHQHAVKQIDLETGLRRAIEQDELRLCYQPVIAFRTGRIVGLEALVRWQHPARGLLSPVEFLRLAEETQLMVPLTQWVLRRACSQARQWRELFPNTGSANISVNVTAPFLTRPNLREELLGMIRDYGLTPDTLRLEITEGEILGELALVASALRELTTCGIKICIDDFGTGYSSLSHLATFAIQVLKIDQSFIRNVNGADRTSAIVQSIVSMANNLGLDVIAEGVETQEQLNYLRSIGCQFGQGYLFSPPVDEQKTTTLLKEGLRVGIEEPSAGDGRVQASRLQYFELFPGLGDNVLDVIAKCSSGVTMRKGDLVIRQGQVGDRIYLLEEGSVGIYRGTSEPSQFLAVLHAPTVFGEMAIVNPERIRTANVKALTDLRVLAIPLSAFLPLLQAHPPLKQNLLRLVANRTKNPRSEPASAEIGR